MDGRSVVVVKPHGIRSNRTGLRRSRGNADVKYQYHGDVPQADAPRLSRDGNTFDKNAASSGHRRVRDCQKKVSMLTVKSRPAIVADRMAGRNTVRTRETADERFADLASR